MSTSNQLGAPTVTSSGFMPARGLPRIGEPAPDFEAKTTHGLFRLSELQGKWVVLFSHPADFTPVCTTEFIGFARHFEDFERRNVALIGLSIDSIFAHLAWTRTIKEKFGVAIPFPIIEDLDMHVASLYGMIHPSASTTQAVRALFVIDDKGMLRAMVYYPLSNGRSILEILRLVDGLQTTDGYGVATPEGWKPGEDVIVPPPKTEEELQARLSSNYACTDWFFCKRPLKVDA